MSVELNNRIAKNTFFLYLRMIVIMIVSLYTVRVVLNELGEVDYGILNVVSGVVILFSFLSGTMSSASQRYFAVEISSGNNVRLNRLFSIVMLIYFLIALLVFIISESFGLWFLNTQMSIPDDRIVAANWVYQFSIFTLIVNMVTIPYNAIIISYEKMNIYAVISILEAFLKLCTAYLLTILKHDKLIVYSILIFFTTCILSLIYRTYCKNKFNIFKYKFYWDKKLFKEVASFSTWNLFGALAGICNSQGINILLNIFFGPLINTSRSIAVQISDSINQLTLNFMSATRPQIIKYYASNSKEEMLNLVFTSSKFSYLLLYIISMPILLKTEYLISLWLKNPPVYSVLFTKIVIITSLIDSLSYSLMTASQATGSIKKYQLVVGGTMLLNLPISFLFLKLEFYPQIVFIIALINSIICLFLRLVLLRSMVSLNLNDFIMKVLLKIITFTIASSLLPILMSFKLENNVLNFIILITTVLVSSTLSLYLFAFSDKEKLLMRHYVKKAYILISRKNTTVD